MINAPILHVNGDYPEGKQLSSVLIEYSNATHGQMLQGQLTLQSNIEMLSER
jgi:hypothetical protein